MLLDKRQRAMLKEIGVRVWQPPPDQAPAKPATSMASAVTASAAAVSDNPVFAIDSGADSPRINAAAAPFNPKKLPVASVPVVAQAQTAGPAWRVGTVQTLYAETADKTAVRWLVLLEAPASALQDFNPLDGDAGKLLDNMLRAAGLHVASSVLLAPLVRAGTGGDLPGALTDMLANTKANVVLVMGRLAAQALLQSTEPLAKLRGQVHNVQGQQTIITIDPAYLLRNPLEKAKAWDDLCLALSVARRVSTA